MRRTAIGGAILAVATFLLVIFGQALDLDLDRTALTGAALGAVVALVPGRPPMWRAIGFAAGFLLTWLGYGLRAGFLPDTSFGRALAALVVMLLLMAVSVAAGTRVPLWSLLCGAAAMAAAYETIFMLTPSAFPYESPTAATQVALAAGVGYLAASFLGPAVEPERAHKIERSRHARPVGKPRTRLDALLTKNEA
jgi:fucose permease